MEYKLVKIPLLDITTHPENYNSNFHSSSEIPNLSIPLETPQTFSRWLSLITSSRGIPSSSIQNLTLNKAQSTLLLEAAKTSLHTRRPNLLLTEELSDLCFSSPLNTLQFPREGLFLRLDASSPKDGVNASKPIRTVEYVLDRLTTSHRANNAITRALEVEGETKLCFLPWNEEMDTRREFRVFCAKGGRIVGVSQYKWYTTSIFVESGEEALQSVIKIIWEGIQRVHGEIMTEVESEIGGELDELMIKQGFSFDVWFNDGAGCLLIELNSFGARSGCGSCLFHWLRDFKLLDGDGENKGNGEREVEIRIAV